MVSSKIIKNKTRAKRPFEQMSDRRRDSDQGDEKRILEREASSASFPPHEEDEALAALLADAAFKEDVESASSSAIQEDFHRTLHKIEVLTFFTRTKQYRSILRFWGTSR